MILMPDTLTHPGPSGQIQEPCTCVRCEMARLKSTVEEAVHELGNAAPPALYAVKNLTARAQSFADIEARRLGILSALERVAAVHRRLADALRAVQIGADPLDGRTGQGVG